MSLVEKALKKMASARVATASAAAAPRNTEAALDRSRSAAAAAVVPTASVREPEPPQAAIARTDRVITFNFPQLRAAGLLPEEDEQRRLTAEYRQIKRPLIAAARGRGVPALHNGRVIMVASALPGEGKTFTSLNLALTLALEKETTVLLVDGDLAKAHISRALGVKEEPGLTDLLLDETAETASAIIPTSIAGVSMLPAGRGAATATELLASSRMERLISEMLSRDPTRIVVFDSPPVLLTTEARALASVAGQIVVVVRAQGTVHKAVRDALQFLGEDKPIGLVLNQCRPNGGHTYYGYGEYGDSTDSRTGSP